MNHSTNFDNFRKDWKTLSGKIPFRMTNDYLFRAITQESKMALRGLLSAILHIRQEDISFLEIMNPIVLGQAIDDKEFILDVKITMNNNTIIDLELQVINYHNWPDRSLQYLCRVFNSLKQGQDYDETIAVIHIGILDFDLFPEESALVDSFRITNTKTGKVYSDKFRFFIMNLPERNNPTDEDLIFHTQLWAEFFKSTTWEEFSMLAQKDESIDAAVDTAFRLMSDEAIRERVFAREDYYRNQRSLERWAESQRLKAEESRREAEENRKKAEENRKEAEESRKEAEESRKEAEESRKEAEESRKEAEESKEAEENRKRAEDAEAELLRLRELLRKSGLDTELDKK